MAANTSFTISEIDYDSLKLSLKNFLEGKAEFSDYDFDSSVLNTLLNVLTYNTYHNSYYNNMVARKVKISHPIP